MNPLYICCRFTVRAVFRRAPYSVPLAITLLACSLLSTPSFATAKLDAAVIQSSTVYDAAELFEVYKGWLGDTVTERTAVAIAESLQQKYLDDGYSQPGYRISDRGTGSGIVRLTVVEASVSRVQFDGDPGPYGRELEDLARNLPADGAMRPEKLRQLLRRAQRIPGLQVSAAAKPDEERAGAFVIALKSNYKPIEGSLKLSNRGTSTVGPNLASARMVANGLLGRESSGGLFATSAEDSDNYLGGGIFANRPLGDQGTLASLQAAVTSLQFETQGVEVQQRRERASIKVRHRSPRENNTEVVLWGGFDAENLDVQYNEFTAREERLRSLQLGLSRSVKMGGRQSLVSAELEQGLNGLGSRFSNFARSGDETERAFSIARLQYVKVSQLSELWVWRWDVMAQLSPDVLPSIKQFKVGGGRIGRGFEAAAVRGDQGIGGKMELRRLVARNAGWLGRADLYGYYDLGSAWRHNVSGRESASSAGLGVAVRGDWLSGHVEVAQPLTHADAEGRRDASLFAEISARF